MRHLNRRVRGAFPAAWVAVVVLLIAGCAELLPPPPPPPPPPPDGENFRQALTVQAGVSAAQLTFAFDPEEVGFRGLSDLGAGVSAAAVRQEEGTEVAITLFSEAPLDGDVLSIHWVIAEGAAPPLITTANAYSADGSPANGSVSVGQLAVDTATDLLEVSVDLSEFDAGDEISAACLSATYQPAVADYSLGDVDQSGAVDVRDVLLAHSALFTDTIDVEDSFALFHLDLTGDCKYDQNDVEQLFMKAADAGLAAKPVLKPSALTYADLHAGNAVLVGNAGNVLLDEVAFEGTNLDGSVLQATLEWTIEGISGLWQVEGDPNDALGTLTVSVDGATDSVQIGNIAILIAGQSNAVGWDDAFPSHLTQPIPGVFALANDYRWGPATEPLDDPAGQLDPVSMDNGAEIGTSAGTELGRLLYYGDDAVGIDRSRRDVYLIPAALGASRMTPRPNGVGWYKGTADLDGADRGTLFGSAAYRTLVSAGSASNPSGEAALGGPLSAVYWYQGESDNSNASLRSDYSIFTEAVFDAFRQHIRSTTAAVDPVIIYAQLAAYGCCEENESATQAEVEDLRSADIAERQRRLEDGAPYLGTPKLIPDSGLVNGVQRAYMVVTHDLPRSDRIHISADGQMILARRVALAYQEHVLGWDVDGTGPRLTGLARDGNTITLTFDRPVTISASGGADAYSGYFTAYWGPPASGGNDYDSHYGGNEATISSLERVADEPNKVRIELASSELSTADIYLRYKRPFEATSSSQYLADVIRGQESDLPLPSFGPLKVP